jgi:hexosaminidase
MKLQKLLLVVALALPVTILSAQNRRQLPQPAEFNLIPKPVSAVYLPGALPILTTLTISDALPRNAASVLAAGFCEDLGTETTVAPDEGSFVKFAWDTKLGEEAYKVVVSEDGIALSAADERGALWAVQTLRQMIKQTALYYSGAMKRLPFSTIQDEPRYHWRGFHWDVSRHFFSKEYVLEHLERLSFYKINKFHFHLSDDQGWRVQIDRYPELTEVGGFRTFNRMDSASLRGSRFNADVRLEPQFVRENGTYGGFYTKDDIREIVARAAELGIDVIPEIDMPGHMSAAIRAFPWLSCTGEEGWQSEFSVPLCASNPRVREFMKNVLAEIADLFPYEYIHIGADEVEKGTWSECPSCQAMMKKKKMKSEADLQTDFVNDMYAFLKTKGKKSMVWDDAAADGHIATDILVTYWRDWLPQNASSIVEKGHQMVFMDWAYFYLSGSTSTPQFKRMYDFDITDDYIGMTPYSIIGLQACVWTEQIFNPGKFEDHVWPALQGFVEIVWGSERNWDDFLRRLPLHLRIMDREGVKYHYHDFSTLEKR